MEDTRQRVQRAKEWLFKETLSPAGFVKGRHLFYRRAGDRVHGIDFQLGSKRSLEYFVNIAFTYAFLPVYERTGFELLEPSRLDLTQFMFYGRLEGLISGSSPRDRSYDLDPDALEQQLRKNARDAIEALNSVDAAWKDPTSLLELLPPRLLQDDHEQRMARVGGNAEEQVMMPPLPYRSVVGPAWQPPDKYFVGYRLAAISIRSGDEVGAIAYLRFTQADALGRQEITIEKLCEQMRIGR